MKNQAFSKILLCSILASIFSINGSFNNLNQTDNTVLIPGAPLQKTELDESELLKAIENNRDGGRAIIKKTNSNVIFDFSSS